MTLPIADRWFERRRIDDDITLLCVRWNGAGSSPPAGA